MKKKLLITGGKGLVGSAIASFGNQYPGFEDFEVFPISRAYYEGDLTHPEVVESIFDFYEPTHVIHCAARVGGVGRNLNSPVEQFNDNIMMNTNVIKTAYERGVEKLIAFSSVCVFPPDKVIKEENIHEGPPFPAHWSYAMAKRMVDVQIESYRNQYGCDFCSVIPGNLFGENDNYNLEDGHVVPSLIHKFYIALQSHYHGDKSKQDVTLWGDGSPVREFLYAKDVARACLELLKRNEKMPQRLIVSGKELSIKDLAEKIRTIWVENVYQGTGPDEFNYWPMIKWDTSKPNGQLKRPSDMTLFHSLFPDFQFTDIDVALKESIKWFYNTGYNNVRK